MNRQLRVLRWVALILFLATNVSGSPGDIRIQVVDMEDRPISSFQGGRATLAGVDDLGLLTIATKPANANGEVIFTAQEINDAILGTFHFAVYTYGSTPGLQGKLYDPFGHLWTYIHYETNGDYSFVVPTPTSGRAGPEVLWNESRSQIRFHVDLGTRDDADFWFSRVILQKPATRLDQITGEFGLTPVIAANWLSLNRYTVDDAGLGNGQTGPLHLVKTNYDQTFLATKTVPEGDTNAQYTVYLLNCLWSRDLVGTYDPANKIYRAQFDPEQIFMDTNAPAWDGYRMQTNIAYFALLQAELWRWHGAGANGGVAISCGPSAAQSIFYPIRYPRVLLNLGCLSATRDRAVLEVHNGSPLLSYTLEWASNLAPHTVWTVLMTTNVEETPFLCIDPAPAAWHRFYRVKQP